MPARSFCPSSEDPMIQRIERVSTLTLSVPLRLRQLFC